MMTSQRKAVVILLSLTLTIAATLLASSAMAQNPRTTTADPSRLITTSSLVVVSAGATFANGKVDFPVCPKTTEFLVTNLYANPSPFESSGDLLSLAKWQASVQVSQRAPNGSFSPYLTVFGEGPQHASALIPGGQPIGPDDNITVRLLSGEAPAPIQFIFHVTGYCGTAFINSGVA